MTWQRQQQTNVRLRQDGLVGEGRHTSAEDHVVAKRNMEFVARGGADVHPRQHAKTLGGVAVLIGRARGNDQVSTLIA
jgi:hypothetical protein